MLCAVAIVLAPAHGHGLKALFGHGIESRRGERTASQDPPDGEDQPGKEAPFFNQNERKKEKIKRSKKQKEKKEKNEF